MLNHTSSVSGAYTRHSDSQSISSSEVHPANTRADSPFVFSTQTGKEVSCRLDLYMRVADCGTRHLSLPVQKTAQVGGAVFAPSVKPSVSASFLALLQSLKIEVPTFPTQYYMDLHSNWEQEEKVRISDDERFEAKVNHKMVASFEAFFVAVYPMRFIHPKEVHSTIRCIENILDRFEIGAYPDWKCSGTSEPSSMGRVSRHYNRLVYPAEVNKRQIEAQERRSGSQHISVELYPLLIKLWNTIYRQDVDSMAVKIFDEIFLVATTGLYLDICQEKLLEEQKVVLSEVLSPGELAAFAFFFCDVCNLKGRVNQKDLILTTSTLLKYLPLDQELKLKNRINSSLLGVRIHRPKVSDLKAFPHQSLV